jgi:hypothetical protein
MESFEAVQHTAQARQAAGLQKTIIYFNFSAVGGRQTLSDAIL